MTIWRGWRYYIYHYPYIWAHQPLCSRFRGETIDIYGVHLCRSCTFVYLGGAAGYFTPIGQFTYVAVLILTLAATVSPAYKKLPRAIRDSCRFALGWSLVATVWLAAQLNPAGMIGGILMVFSYRKLQKTRRQRILRECDDCPERDVQAICSGYGQQAASLERYHERLTELVYAKRKEFYGAE